MSVSVTDRCVIGASCVMEGSEELPRDTVIHGALSQRYRRRVATQVWQRRVVTVLWEEKCLQV